MKAVIDTSSLLSLVRYYLPNDRNKILYEFIKRKLIDDKLLILDGVLEECSYVAKRIIPDTLKFLSDKSFCKEYKIGKNTEFLVPHSSKKFYRMVDHNFVIRSQKNRLSEEEYNASKTEFLESPDCKMIIKCLNLTTEGEFCILITEESRQTNDKKIFKKIPLICDELSIDTCNIQEYIEKTGEIHIEIKIHQ